MRDNLFQLFDRSEVELVLLPVPASVLVIVVLVFGLEGRVLLYDINIFS